MPSCRSNERTEQNEPVYKGYCNPIAKEFYKELTGNLDECFVIQNVSILDGKKGLFATMPSARIGILANGKGRYKDVCYPVTADFKK